MILSDTILSSSSFSFIFKWRTNYKTQTHFVLDHHLWNDHRHPNEVQRFQLLNRSGWASTLQLLFSQFVGGGQDNNNIKLNSIEKKIHSRRWKIKCRNEIHRAWLMVVDLGPHWLIGWKIPAFSSSHVLSRPVHSQSFRSIDLSATKLPLECFLLI